LSSSLSSSISDDDDGASFRYRAGEAFAAEARLELLEAAEARAEGMAGSARVRLSLETTRAGWRPAWRSVRWEVAFPSRGLTLGGARVYAAVFDSHCETTHGSCDGLVAGYSNRTAHGTPVGTEAQTVYALVDGRHFNTGCCFEFGSAETTQTRVGGSMEAVFYGCNDTHPPLPPCTRGPYAYPDLEHMHEMMALPDYEPVRLPPVDFRFALVKGEPGRLSLAVADAQRDAAPLVVLDGPYPANFTSKKQGGIVLGVGGDNSPYGRGTFYEGVIARGFSSSAVDAAVLANIVAARYSRP
jgi:hypothetical protein